MMMAKAIKELEVGKTYRWVRRNFNVRIHSSPFPGNEPMFASDTHKFEGVTTLVKVGVPEKLETAGTKDILHWSITLRDTSGEERTFWVDRNLVCYTWASCGPVYLQRVIYHAGMV